MSGIKRQTLTRALAMLNAIGVSYAVIEEDGTKHGDLDVVEKKRRASSKHKHGELSAYVKKHMESMEISDIKEIPFGQFEGEPVRSSATSWACYNWGNGSVTTAINKQTQLVEILRIA